MRRLTDPEMREIDYEVMRHAFDTHNTLGCLCDEQVYQAHLLQALHEFGFQVDSHVPMVLHFRNYLTTLRPDLVLNRSVVYELKTVSCLTEAHITQVLNYLFITNSTRGKLINFRPSSVESRYVNTSLCDEDRHAIEIDSRRWHGQSDFQWLIEELVQDWGTGLDQCLYRNAVIHCLGGEERVTQQLPMKIRGKSQGNQRFHLVNSDIAFGITTFQEELADHHAIQFRKLLAPSPLRSFYWANIARHKVSLQSINLRE